MDDPDLDNHQFMANVTGLDRKIAKALYLGLCYGEGGAKLSDDLGLPTRWALTTGTWGSPLAYFETREDALKKRAEQGKGFAWRVAGLEGQDVIDKFNERAPFIRELADKAEAVVKRLGQVRTIGKRLLHFSQRDDGSFEWTHKALNRVIQGSSADQTKRALVNVDKAGHHIMLQVHDELDNSVADRAEGEAISKIMEEAIRSKWVPFRVDLELGPSWGEIK
jgi:DNA polymerase I-like protein with 3'-5' exonuclease and polymerase domains